MPAYTAADGNQTTIQALHDQAYVRDDDTLYVPAGTWRWRDTTRLNITKAITLQGMGIGQTIILDDGTADWIYGGLGNITLVPNKTTRVTGFSFRNGTRAIKSCNCFGISGANWDARRFRFDACEVYLPLTGWFLSTYNLLGVADNCDVTLAGNQFFVYIFNTTWNAHLYPSVWYGDASYIDTNHFGTDLFFFIETCTIRNIAAVYGATDAYSGARYVVRHCHLINTFVSCHGTESSGRFRGTRAVEAYENTIELNVLGAAGAGQAELVDARSGVYRIHHNTGTNFQHAQGLIGYKAQKMDYPFGFGQANGRSEWDVNEPGGPFDTGTCTAVPARTGWSIYMTDSGKAWAPNRWYGYTCENVATGKYAKVFSNTATTLELSTCGGFPNGDIEFTVGQQYRFWRCRQVLDQPGVSGGSLLSGDNPTPPPGWNNQTLDPSYAWGNSINGNPAPTSGNFGYAPIVPGVHFFDNTPPPPGENYQPYAYPHPLTTGAPPPPPPPPPPPMVTLAGRARAAFMRLRGWLFLPPAAPTNVRIE